MKFTNINDVITILDKKHYEFKHALSSMIKSKDLFFLKNVTEQFLGKNIKITSTTFSYINSKGLLTGNKKNNLLIENCHFDRLDIEADFSHIFIYNSTIKHLVIKNVKMDNLLLKGKVDNLNIENSNFIDISIESSIDSKSFVFDNLSTKKLSISVKTIDYLQVNAINNCELISISNQSHENETIIKKFKSTWLDGVKLFKISSFRNIPITIHDFEIDRFQDIETLIINNTTLGTCILKGNKSYENIIFNISHLNILKLLKISDCDMKNSTFRDINLSKCFFDNSLIADTKFYECDFEEISDIPLTKFKKLVNWFTVIFYISSLLIITYFSAYINTYFWTSFVTTVMIGLIFLSGSSSIFVNAKHSRTFDEIDKLKGDNFLPSFIKGISIQEKKKLEEIESVYRQLKVSFEREHNKQRANDFLYSESIMKLRQKTLFKNIISVDFYNYLVNGFGRRWRRAFINFFASLLLALVTFIFIADSYTVTDKAPDFLQEAQLEVFSKNVVDENNVTIPKDGLIFVDNLLTMSGTYTISKIDIFRIKTRGWFEEKNFLSLLTNNFIGLILVFLFASFILAFKRRLDK